MTSILSGGRGNGTVIGRMLNRKTEEIPAGFRSVKVEVTKRDEKVLSLSLSVSFQFFFSLFLSFSPTLFFLLPFFLSFFLLYFFPFIPVPSVSFFRISLACFLGCARVGELKLFTSKNKRTSG